MNCRGGGCDPVGVAGIGVVDVDVAAAVGKRW
jgi:hypothetical protein